LLSLLTQICLVREIVRWKLKGGDLKLVIILFFKPALNLHLSISIGQSPLQGRSASKATAMIQ
jgi:hypothetical protein